MHSYNIICFTYVCAIDSVFRAAEKQNANKHSKLQYIASYVVT